MASGSAVGRMLEKVTGQYTRMPIKEFAVLDNVGPQKPALHRVKNQDSQSFSIVESGHAIDAPRPSPLHPFQYSEVLHIPGVPDTRTVL